MEGIAMVKENVMKLGYSQVANAPQFSLRDRTPEKTLLRRVERWSNRLKVSRVRWTLLVEQPPHLDQIDRAFEPDSLWESSERAKIAVQIAVCRLKKILLFAHSFTSTATNKKYSKICRSSYWLSAFLMASAVQNKLWVERLHCQTLQNKVDKLFPTLSALLLEWCENIQK